MFAYYLRVEKVFLENKKAHTGQIKGITAGLKPTEKQKKFDTFTVSNLIGSLKYKVGRLLPLPFCGW